MLAIFAGVALLLASVGIYGVMAFAVTQRTQEIGIRMALGAQRRQVLFAVMREGTRLSLYGVGAGLLLALGLKEFSLHPATLLEVRRAIRGCDLSQLRRRASALMRAGSRAAIERWLASACETAA